jgi:dihydrofolate reductase
MTRVIAGMTMSLDGFINDRNGDVSRLYPDFDALRESDAVQEAMERTGAVVMGRRSYDMANGDFTGYEFQTPIFVLTHRPPDQVAKGENDKLSFTFVTDGIESAIAQAKAAAGDKDVTVVGGASTIQQCIKTGLVDELEIDLRPIFLGDGTRLFDGLGDTSVEMETIRVTESPAVTHLRFRVVK